MIPPEIYNIYRENSVWKKLTAAYKIELLRIQEMLKIVLTKISLFFMFLSYLSYFFLFATLLVYILPRLQSQKNWTNIKSNSLDLCWFSSSITQLMGFHSVFVSNSTAVCQLSLFNWCLNLDMIIRRLSDHPSMT